MTSINKSILCVGALLSNAFTLNQGPGQRHEEMRLPFTRQPTAVRPIIAKSDSFCPNGMRSREATPKQLTMGRRQWEQSRRDGWA